MSTLVALLEKACVLVTLTFVLTSLLPANVRLLRPRLSKREQALALLVFLAMVFVEEVMARQHTLMNPRIIAVCAAGLLAGPWVGGLIGVAATLMAYATRHYPPIPIGLSMLLAGLAGGLLHRWRPAFALRPLTGFVLGLLTSLLRYALALAFLAVSPATTSAQGLTAEILAAIIHGIAVALILLVVAQVRTRESRTQAAAQAEVRALQARMNPHFLFNALNTLSALSIIDPRAIPRAAARLGQFLRASLDQHEQPFVSLQEELDVVTAYLDVEALRLGERLIVEQEIAPSLLTASVPPFLLQPLVENAIQHGLQPREAGGVVRITVTEEEAWLLLTVSDTGCGIAPEKQAMLFRSDTGHVHALTLLRRRLRGLYGQDFRLTVESGPGAGTTVSVRILRQKVRLLPEQEFDSQREAERDLQEAEACTVVRLR